MCFYMLLALDYFNLASNILQGWYLCLAEVRVGKTQVPGLKPL